MSTKDVTFKLKCEVDEGAIKAIDTIEEKLTKLHKLTEIKLKIELDGSVDATLDKLEKRLDELQKKATITIKSEGGDSGQSGRTRPGRKAKRSSGRMRKPSRTADSTQQRKASPRQSQPPKVKTSRAAPAESVKRPAETQPTAKRSSGRMRQPSRTRDLPDSRTTPKVEKSAKSRPTKPATQRTEKPMDGVKQPPVQKPARRDRDAAKALTASKNNKPRTAQGGSVKKQGRTIKPVSSPVVARTASPKPARSNTRPMMRSPSRAKLPKMGGKVGAVVNIAQMGANLLGVTPQSIADNVTRRSGAAASQQEQESEEVPLSKDEILSNRIVDSFQTGATNLLNSGGLKQNEANNIEQTIALTTTAAEVFGPKGAAVAAVAGSAYTAGNYLGRRLDGTQEAEDQLAKNLEQEQKLIDASPEIRDREQSKYESKRSKEREQRDANLAKDILSDDESFAFDRSQAANLPATSRLSAIDEQTSKNTSERDKAAEDVSRLESLLAKATEQEGMTSLGMEKDNIATDLESKTQLLLQQEMQLKQLAEDRQRIEEEIASTRSKTSSESVDSESSSKPKRGEQDQESEVDEESIGSKASDKIAGSVEKVLDRLATRFEERMNAFNQDYENVRNGG